MVEYLKKMRLKFEHATGMKDDTSFNYWLQNNIAYLMYYLEFLRRIGLNLDESVIELNKGKYDTFGLVLPSQDRLIEISPWAFSIDNNKVFKCNGSLIVKEKKPIILNHGVESCIDISNNLQYLLDLSLYYEEKTKIFELAELGRDIYFGTSGYINSLNRVEKIIALMNYKNELEKMNLDILATGTIVNDCYIQVLRIKKK